MAAEATDAYEHYGVQQFDIISSFPVVVTVTLAIAGPNVIGN